MKKINPPKNVCGGSQSNEIPNEENASKSFLFQWWWCLSFVCQTMSRRVSCQFKRHLILNNLPKVLFFEMIIPKKYFKIICVTFFSKVTSAFKRFMSVFSHKKIQSETIVNRGRNNCIENLLIECLCVNSLSDWKIMSWKSCLDNHCLEWLFLKDCPLQTSNEQQVYICIPNNRFFQQLLSSKVCHFS